jgi:hypothetical protein
MFGGSLSKSTNLSNESSPISKKNFAFDALLIHETQKPHTRARNRILESHASHLRHSPATRRRRFGALEIGTASKPLDE